MTLATTTFHSPDHPADAARSRTWQVSTTSGCTVTGYLPPWADEDPSRSGVAIERLGVQLADIVHTAAFPGQLAHVTSTEGPAEETVILSGSIDCRPYTEDPAPRVPVAHLQLVDDYWITDLDPDLLTEIAALLHAQAVRLETEVRPRLVAARTDWQRQGG